MNMKIKILLFAAAVFLSAAARPVTGADSLFVDTEYRLRSINISNLDYDKATSSDTLNYYEQRISISIGGRFSPGVEIGSKITATDLQGETTGFFNVPYPRTDFTPYVENAFVKINRVADTGLDLTVGKAPLEFGDGLIVSDNGTGFNVIELDGQLRIPLPYAYWAPGKPFKYGIYWLPSKFRSFMSKISEKINRDMDNDVAGGSATIEIFDHAVEFGYFDSRDYSNSMYSLGTINMPTFSILKQFYDLRVGKQFNSWSYSVECARQEGLLTKNDTHTIKFAGYGTVMKGNYLFEKTKLGKIEARAMCSMFSGSESIGVNTTDEETAFTPDYTKRWDGFKRGAYGELFGATPFDSFMTLNPEYTGINTINAGVSVMPRDIWTISADFLMFSAARGRAGKDTSWLEQRFGGRYSLGTELDMGIKLAMNKYASFKVSFARFNPPDSDDFAPNQDPVDRYAMEMLAKF